MVRPTVLRVVAEQFAALFPVGFVGPRTIVFPIMRVHTSCRRHQHVSGYRFCEGHGAPETSIALVSCRR